MAAKRYKLIDVGSKIGGSLGKYRKMLPGTILRQPQPKPSDCLAIERNKKYEQTLRDAGYDVLIRDFFDLIDKKELPKSDVYLACNVLEHFKSIEASKHALKHMIWNSYVGVWLRLPSFEQDETGEGRLREHNLRFSWTSWRHHSSHFCLQHVKELLSTLDIKHTLRITPGRVIATSDYPSIVPNLDQPELDNYDPQLHGPRTNVIFNPPIVGEWDVQIALKWK